MESGLFNFFAVIMLTSIFLVITVKNAIYSVLFLILSFVSSALLLFFLECDFLAFLFILIYVGAITILFLFAVMLLDFKSNIFALDSVKYFPFGTSIGSIFLFELLSIIYKSFKANYFLTEFKTNNYNNWYNLTDQITYVKLFGQTLYTHYVLQFLISGMILFLAVISVSVLTRKL
jgi:NADH-quinone oxidoreductase subunit J